MAGDVHPTPLKERLTFLASRELTYLIDLALVSRFLSDSLFGELKSKYVNSSLAARIFFHSPCRFSFWLELIAL